MRTIRIGDIGEDVTALQRALTAAGHPCDADGRFGPKTLAAVKAFQVARGLAPDGIVGPRTMAALEALAPTDRPPPTEIWGVDVSEMNGKVPYAALAREGCAFVVVRCMTGSDRDGVMRPDKDFQRHVDGFAAVGVPTIGSYAWTSERRDGAEQADLALHVTKDVGGFLSLDHEPAPNRTAFADPAKATEVGCDFAATVLDACRAFAVYASPNALTVAPLPGLERWPLWLAHYGLTHWPAAPRPWRVVTLWQPGKVMGIDKNVFRGTLEELRRAMGTP
jgi:GH25 family lysozyme M1 (1,4-beta-N-acetylmuramidase)